MTDTKPQSLNIPAAEWYQGDNIVITRAYAAPAPDSPHYAPFLIHIARLFQKGMIGYTPGAVPPVQYALIDDPAALYLSASATSDDETPAARAKMDDLIASITTEQGGKPADAAIVAMQFGWMFGSADAPDAALKNNPYGVAFGLGRAELMGIDWSALHDRLNNLTRNDMTAAADAIFSESNSAEVIASVDRNSQ